MSQRAGERVSGRGLPLRSGRANGRGQAASCARRGRGHRCARSPARPLARSAAAALAVVIALSACRPAAPPAGRERLRNEPEVRVGVVVDSNALSVSSTAPLEVVSPSGDVVARGEPGTAWTIVADSARRLSGSGGGTSFGPVSGPLALRLNGQGVVQVGARPYRGSLLVRSDAPARVSAINTLAMETYLRGVVPFEIGRRPASEIEAVKAQAVAARTYAVGNMNHRPNFDFYATVQDQVYGGMSGEDSITSRAVAETAGEIVTYQGQPILAYYSSTCGGQTAAIQQSWPWRAPQPYLQSVSDRIPGSDRAYCDISGRYRWTTRWTLDQLRAALSSTLGALVRHPVAPVQRVEDVRILARNGSGRVDSLRIRADGRDYLVRADSLRWVLRTPAGAGLNSSLLLDAAFHPADSVALEVHGGGWGHGIGMCQFGAIGRARAGQSYRTILGTYYQGTRITRLY